MLSYEEADFVIYINMTSRTMYHQEEVLASILSGFLVANMSFGLGDIHVMYVPQYTC